MSMGKIMVADDDTNICELLRLYLEKEGYTVTLAHDGESAVEQFFADTPDLLLLDEPINGLDPEGIRQMRDLLLRLNRERGLTILISSHILGELSKIATRYGIIQQGRLVEQLTAGELEQKCTDYLHIKADQPQKAAALLEQQLHLTRWEMRPEGELRIYETADARAVGQLLAQAGIAVEEMGLHRQDLEGYFLEKMGGADHV